MTQLRKRAAFASFIALSLCSPRCAAAQDTAAGGPPVRLDATLDGKLRADGRTPVLLKIEAIDRFSHRAATGTPVRVEIVGGDARFERIGRLRTDYLNLSGSPNLFDTDHLKTYPLPNGNGELAPSPAPNGAPDAGTPVVNQVTPDRPTVIQQQTARATTDSVGTYVRAGDDSAAGRTNLSTPGDDLAASQSVDLKVSADGDLTVPIFPGTTAGPIRVRVSSGDISSEYGFTVEPNYRAPIVTGLLTAGAGAVPAPPGLPDDAADGFQTRRGRVALYATGETLPSTLVTVAYDTANRLTRSPSTGPYIDDPNDRPFSTYGDSSSRYLDALSRDHLYARVDTPHAAGMWGEFIADTGNHDASAPDGFNLLVDGIKGEGRFSSDRGQVSAFNANNDVAYARQIINPNDLATFNTTLHPGIVLGSDTFTLVTFDRRTGATIAQRVLARNVDYTLDYYTGRLYFINVPLRFDDNFNPQSLLVQYEYTGVGSSSVTGGRFDYALGRGNGTRVGFGYANYATGSNNATTTTEDLTGKIKGGTWSFAHETGTGPSVFGDTFLPASALQSNGTTSGDLWRAGVNVAGGPSRYQLAYTTTSSGLRQSLRRHRDAGLHELLGFVRLLVRGRSRRSDRALRRSTQRSRRDHWQSEYDRPRCAPPSRETPDAQRRLAPSGGLGVVFLGIIDGAQRLAARGQPRASAEFEQHARQRRRRLSHRADRRTFTRATLQHQRHELQRARSDGGAAQRRFSRQGPRVRASAVVGFADASLCNVVVALHASRAVARVDGTRFRTRRRPQYDDR